MIDTTVDAPAELVHERDGSVVMLRLDRPAVRNALGTALVSRLRMALAALDRDPGVSVVILTGTPPGFCAGSDLRELAGMSGTGRLGHEARTGQLVRELAGLSIPVVAAVEGFAIGGGFLLAAGCDIVVSADDARWRLPEVSLGWVPPWGLQALVDRAGPAAARRLAWGYQHPSAAELHRLGVVDLLTAPGGAATAARLVADRLAQLPRHAVASTKRAFATVVRDPARALDAETTRLFGEDCRSSAAHSSLAAYRRRERGRR